MFSLLSCCLYILVLYRALQAHVDVTYVAWNYVTRLAFTICLLHSIFLFLFFFFLLTAPLDFNPHKIWTFPC